MKIFAVFMTVVMLLSGLALCKDDEALNSKEKVELSKSFEDDHDSGDVCSPFCPCARCPFSILPQLSEKSRIYQLSKKIFTDATWGNPIQISPSFWQPPKFA